MAAHSTTTFGRHIVMVPHSRPRSTLSRPSTLEDLAKIRALPSCRPKKPHRIIAVYYYPNRVLHLKISYDKKDYMTAGGIKEVLNDLLRIEQCYTPFFGVFSGTLECPLKLLSDSDIIPEDTSQFSLKKLSFKIEEEGQTMIFHRSAEELLFLETLFQFASRSIVPHPDLVTQQCINKLIEDKNVTTFWRLLNNRSSCSSIQSLAICQKDIYKSASSNEIVVIKIALDLKGIHFFDVDGEVLIMTWPWTTISNFKVQTHHTQLFMFDIVVREKESSFLRTIIIQTSSCEYLLSMAKYILKIHNIYPEVPAGVGLRGASSQYVSQFKARHCSPKPYSLLDCQPKTLFRNYPNEGSLKQARKEICRNLTNYPNMAYSRPMAVYIPAEKYRLPAFREVSITTYKVFYYSKLSVEKKSESESDLSYTESYINVQVATELGCPCRVRDIKLAVAKGLNLSKGSLKYFGLFTNIIGRRIDLLHDRDNMPASFLGLCFRTTILTWRKENHLEQWNYFTHDERAACLVFWEVVAGHGSLLRDAEQVLAKFIYRCSLCDLLYTLGSIVDLYCADDCKLQNTIVSSTNIRYDEGSQVILSLDEDRLHVWDYLTGKRIISFSWFYISGIKMQHDPKLTLTYTIVKGHESGYNALSVRTNGAPFLYCISKQFSKNIDNRLDHTSEYLCADKSENGEMTAEEQKGIEIPGSCKEMINSLVKEAECYAKQNEKESIWRLIERIEKRSREMPSFETIASKKKWSEDLYHRAAILISSHDIVESKDKEVINEFEVPDVSDSEGMYYCPQRWVNVNKKSDHVCLLIEPHAGLRSFVSFFSLPEQPMDFPPPSHLSRLIEILSRISPDLNGKQFLNCFLPTLRTRVTLHCMPAKKRISTKDIVFKYARSKRFNY